MAVCHVVATPLDVCDDAPIVERFFHGRQLPGSRLPIAVSFSESKAAKSNAKPKKAPVAKLYAPWNGGFGIPSVPKSKRFNSQSYDFSSQSCLKVGAKLKQCRVLCNHVSPGKQM